MTYPTQDAPHGAVQGVTQDSEQYAPDERPGGSTPTGPTSAASTPAPVEPGDPKDPGGAGDPVQPPEPQVVPSSTPDGPQTIPVAPTPEGEPGPDSQLENAGTSLDEPSDNSGSE